MPADVLALFDLDQTLLDGDCDEAWVAYLVERGVLDATFQLRNRDVVERYGRGEIGVREFTEFYVSTLALGAMPMLEAWRADYVQSRILPMISAAARELVQQHRANDDLMVLTTAANRFITAPIAPELGLDNVIATEPELRDGAFTGRVAGTPNMREGKIARLEQWLASRGQTLGGFRKSFFYSDSRNDIPLLCAVTDPVAVNADPALAELARERGWATLRIR